MLITAKLNIHNLRRDAGPLRIRQLPAELTYRPRSMPRRRGPSATAIERCAASGTESRRKGSFSAAGPGKNAFHRRWPMRWRGRRQTGVKRKRRCRPSRPSHVHAGRNPGQVPSSAVHDFLPGGAQLLQFCHPVDQRQVAVEGGRAGQTFSILIWRVLWGRATRKADAEAQRATPLKPD
jgi:hypothetical protein